MTPLNEAVTELRMVVDRAVMRAPSARSGSALEDFRTETVSDLLDAMDRIDPYIGTTLMDCIYPRPGFPVRTRDGLIVGSGA